MSHPLRLGIIGGLLLGLAACKHPPPPARVPVAVEVLKITRGEATSTYRTTGDIHAAVESTLSFRLSGKVVERKVDVGDRITAGQVLARLDAQQQQADVAVAEAGVRSAAAALAHAKLEAERDRQLFEHGAIAKAALDASERDFDGAKASFAAAEAGRAMARDALSFTELRAASDGVITTRSVEAGQVMQAGQPAYGLADSGERDAVFQVEEAIAGRIRPDTRIAVSLVDTPAVTVEGTVREIAPIVDATNGSVRIKVRLGTLPKGMDLGAPVVGQLGLRATETFTVPPSAIAADDAGHPSVFVVDPKTNAVAVRPVDVAAYESGSIVVRDGLADGEIVVARGASLLRPGQVVRFSEGGRS